MHRSTIAERFARILIAIIPVLMIAGCASSRTSIPPAGGEITVRRIAVLPFQKASPSEVAVRVAREPVILGDMGADRTEDSPERITERIFLDRQKALGRIQIVYPDRAGAAYQSASSGSFTMKAAEILRKMGSDLEVDGIVAGMYIGRRERKGLAYSVEKPDSVAFDIPCTGPATAQFYGAALDQTQASPDGGHASDALIFKEKGRGSLGRMTAAGMEEVCKVFPAALDGCGGEGEGIGSRVRKGDFILIIIPAIDMKDGRCVRWPGRRSAW